MKRPRWSYLLFAHLVLIFVVSVLAATNNLQYSILKLQGVDKLGHFVLYGLLALFASAYFGRTKRVAGILAVLATIEEASQAWFPARTFDLWDLAATLAGIVLFALAYKEISASSSASGGVSSIFRSRAMMKSNAAANARSS